MSLYVCLGCFTVSRRKRENCCSYPKQGGYYAVDRITEQEARELYGWKGDLDKAVAKAEKYHTEGRPKQIWVACSKCGTTGTAFSEYEAQRLLANHDCKEGGGIRKKV